MRTLSGITVPDELYHEALVHKEQDKRMFIERPIEETDMENKLEEGCPNCSGGGVLVLSWVIDGPFNIPPTGAKMRTVDGMWHRADRKSYPCPVCRVSSASALRETLHNDSGLTDDEREFRLDYIEGMEGKDIALDTARELLSYAPNCTGYYTIFGDYGVGKSGVLKSVVAALIRIGVKAKYIRANDMLSLVKSTYTKENEATEMAILQNFSGYQLLAIDEVDRIGTTDWGRATLFAILDERYNVRKSKCTLMATNLYPDSMGTEWSYLMSRMEDGRRVPVGGESLRGRGPGTQAALVT